MPHDVLDADGFERVLVQEFARLADKVLGWRDVLCRVARCYTEWRSDLGLLPASGFAAQDLEKFLCGDFALLDMIRTDA